MTFKVSVRGHVAGGLTLVVNRMGWKLIGVKGSEERPHTYPVGDDGEFDSQSAWDATARLINYELSSEDFIKMFGSFDKTHSVERAQRDFYNVLNGTAMGFKHEMFTNTIQAMDILNSADARQDARITLRHFRVALGLCPDEAHLIEECQGRNCYQWRVGEYINGVGIWRDTTLSFDEDFALVLKHFGVPGSRSFYTRGIPMDISGTYLKISERTII